MPHQKESYNLYPPLTVAIFHLEKSFCVKGLLKFPDIVKLNTCMLFYDYFHHEKFLNIPVSLVSELHNYSTRSASSNQVAIPLFRTNLRRFCPSIIGSFFEMIFCNPLETNHIKKKVKKALCAGTLLNTNEKLSLL